MSDDQHRILKWIIELYVPEGRFDYDPTYSKGVFYKADVPEPKFKSCLTDEGPVDFFADAQHLPFKVDSLNSICFDPPFLASMGKKTEDSIIGSRFGFLKDMQSLWNFYCVFLNEASRVLKLNGVLIFKCQDIVKHAKQWMSHYTIMRYADILGFYMKDLFVLTANTRIIGPTKKQQHARKFHSYFLVFIKEKPKVIYP